VPDVQYRLNFWNRDFFDAIGRKDASGLWQPALRLLPIGTASLTLAIISVWGRMTMQRKWRECLSNYWLERDHIVRLKFMSGEHQAPEYRIAEDARVATDLPIDLLLGLLSCVLVAITFIGVLWKVGGDLVIDALGTEPAGTLTSDWILKFPSVAWATDMPWVVVP
jgi:vitamin B12/bleomycin/antimicrobial peptide transport system ATP-binding/permease protein